MRVLFLALEDFKAKKDELSTGQLCTAAELFTLCVQRRSRRFGTPAGADYEQLWNTNNAMERTADRCALHF